jgi:PBP1b-binding outer membrane lipoprotein LpoB
MKALLLFSVAASAFVLTGCAGINDSNRATRTVADRQSNDTDMINTQNMIETQNMVNEQSAAAAFAASHP